MLSRIESGLETVDTHSWEVLSQHVTALRGQGDEACNAKLDQLLLSRLALLQQSRSELESIYERLREELTKLTTPPFFPARFIGSVALQSGAYAIVSLGGSERVVVVADDVDIDQLHAGDEVYLGHERNVLLSRAPVRRREHGETVTVVRTMGDDRIVVSDRDTEVVTLAGRELEGQALRPGDPILWDRSAGIAFGRIESAGPKGYEDVDNTADVELGGVEHLQEGTLARFVFGILHPETARQYRVASGGMQRLLLNGPPGTGKTAFMRKIAARISRAAERQVRVVTISGAELYSSYVGETERNIRRCFSVLRDYDGPAIVFFDEIDAIGRARGHFSGYHDDRFLGTLLTELEGMRRTDVAVVASTNRADVLDPALRSRFTWEIEMPRPTMAAARSICAIHLPDDLPYRPNGSRAPHTRQSLIEAGVARLFEPNGDNMIASLQFRDGTRREVAARELVSGRLLEQMCVAARASAFARQCAGGAPGLIESDMRSAASEVIARLRGTLTRQNARNYLNDIAEDADVVAVQPMGPRIDADRYLHAASDQPLSGQPQQRER